MQRFSRLAFSLLSCVFQLLLSSRDMVYTYPEGTFLDHVESIIALFLPPLPCLSWHFPVPSVGEVPNPTPSPLAGQCEGFLVDGNEGQI